MIVGVVKEIKDKENRVALTPDAAHKLTVAGHTVRVEGGAGDGSGFADSLYRQAGAILVSAADAWQSDLVLKVKEPLPVEYAFLRGQILFTYLHLAGVDRQLTEALLDSGTTAIAYETVEDEAGKLPLLAPMSAVAGNMAVTVGSYYLARPNGGRGVQLGRVLGEKNGLVLVVGDGVVGRHAAGVAAAMGAQVLVAGRHPERQEELRQQVAPSLCYIPSTEDSIAAHLAQTDLLVGAVLHPGARAPHVVTEKMVGSMPEGSVIVDVSIDQGGCVETSRPTSHSNPVYVKHGVIHYCVTNMPGAYPRTSTVSLVAATLPYVLQLANESVAGLAGQHGFRAGVNTHKGFVTYRPVAEALGITARFRLFEELEKKF